MGVDSKIPLVPTPEELEKSRMRPAPLPSSKPSQEDEGAVEPAQREWERAPGVGPGREYE